MREGTIRSVWKSLEQGEKAVDGAWPRREEGREKGEQSESEREMTKTEG